MKILTSNVIIFKQLKNIGRILTTLVYYKKDILLFSTYCWFFRFVFQKIITCLSPNSNYLAFYKKKIAVQLSASG